MRESQRSFPEPLFLFAYACVSLAETIALSEPHKSPHRTNTLFEQPLPREGQEQGERETDRRTNTQRGRETERGEVREKDGKSSRLSPIHAACSASCLFPSSSSSSPLALSLSLIEVFLWSSSSPARVG